MMRKRVMSHKDLISDELLTQALVYMKKTNNISKASRKFGISQYRLKRYYQLQFKLNNDKTHTQLSTADNSLEARRGIFTTDQENTLKDYFKNFELLFYGLTEKECRILAYQMAIINNLNIPESWNNGMAESDWLWLYKKDHPDLKLERPNRCWGKNRSSIIIERIYVNSFYDNLEKLLTNPDFKNSPRIFSLDETYLSEPTKKLANKQSNGNLITTCCIVSADGTMLPPITILPQSISPQDDNKPKIPTGTITLVAPRGRMSMYLFPKVMQLFIKHSNTTPENPSVLILDIDMGHLSIAAFDLAKTSGVHLLTIHPHVSNILQPLEVGLFDLFQTNYYASIDSWLEISASEEPCKENIPDIDELISEAYTKTMTPANIINAFNKCGIVPYDRDLFTDSDYLSCVIMDPPCFDCRTRDYRGKQPDKISFFANEDEYECETTYISQEEALENIASSDSEEETTEDLTNSEDSKNRSQNLAEQDNPIPEKQQISRPKQNCSSDMSSKQRGAELDKLKRRMIRTVARLLKEKKTEEEVWEELKKESGSGNCKTLWERMRSLTMKKLKRLLTAEDRVEMVPSVARMTLTDWLLYDLVIVHEKIDVIDRSQSTDNKVLSELFSLVQKFSIEGLSGDALAEAWTSATVYYNSKGHQCSPMLMQRRWYQIKELTRHKLYRFWFSYRGNQKLLHKALEDPPTELQKNIALRYPDIITAPFPDWKERIEKKLVIMPEEFEVKMRGKARHFKKPEKVDEAVPDVVILEPKIDTITVGDSESEYSDEESSRSSATSLNPGIINTGTDETTPIIVQVKTEPQDDIETVEHTPYQTPSEERKDRFQAEIERLRMVEDTILINEENSDEMETEVPKSQDEIMPLISDVVGGTKNEVSNDIAMSDKELANANIDCNEPSQGSILIDDDDETAPSNEAQADISNAQATDDNVPKLIDINPEAKRTDTDISNTFENDTSIPTVERIDFYDPDEVFPVITAVKSGLEVETNMEIDTDLPLKENVENQTSHVVEDSEDEKNSLGNNLLQEVVSVVDEIPSEMTFADDGIEFADDGIEYVEDDDQSEISEVPLPLKVENYEEENEGPPKFDLKLLMHPVVYTTKLDEMAVYKERPLLDTIEGKELVDQIMFESKPISAKSVKFEPVIAESQDINENDDDLFQNDSSVESDSDVIVESQKVKISSKLLQKPRSRSYNPIQLCKNPDFNTRLKRLTVGFFSSSRNRALLQVCKPMTIDLSKAFESKLVGGTMYLKPSDQVVKIEADDNLTESTSILPSAVTVRSLMDTTTAEVDRILQEELKKRILERNKTINLPNISVVRQINQQLLSAEVAPIMAQLDKNIVQNMTAAVEKEKLVSSENGVKLDPVTNKTQHLTAGDKLPAHVETYTNFKTQTSTNETFKNVSNTAIIDSNKYKADKQKKLKEHRQKNIPSWFTKKIASEQKVNSESLLTIDTLYKMLSTLDPCTEPLYVSKQRKKSHKLVSKPIDKNESSIDVEEIIECDAMDTQEAVETITNTNNVSGQPVTPVSETVKKKKGRSCCWAKTKIEKIKGNISRVRKHTCMYSSYCTCCCREELSETEIKHKANKINAKNMQQVYGIDTLDDAIEHVVQQWREEPNVTVEQPAVHIVNIDNSESQSPFECNESSRSQLDTVYVVNNAPDAALHETNTEPEFSTPNIPDGQQVTIDLAKEDENVPPLSKINSPPTPLIRVYSGSAPLKQGVPQAVNAPEPRNIHGNRGRPIKKYPNPTILNNNLLPQQPKLAVKYKFSPKETEGSDLPCSCRLNVAVDKLSSTLLVDGSNECLRHTKSRVSKETRIYLNRKHMSVTERPFYVGKNKILLTNVKPPKPQTPPPDQAPITLPNGVQVVLLPDGTITYLVDPNITLTPEQIQTMPLILYAVQQQIKASGITLPVAPQQENVETIDLDDDTEPKDIGTTNNIQNETSNIDGEQNQEHNSANVDESTVTSDSKLEVNEDLVTTTIGLSYVQNDVNFELENRSAHQEHSNHLTDEVHSESGNNDENQEVPNSVSDLTQKVNENTTSYVEISSNEASTLSEVRNIEDNVLADKNHITVDENTSIDTSELAKPNNSQVNGVVENEHNYTVSPEKNTGGLVSTESNNGAGASRNLLSDLMEMSGILEEDVAPVQQEPMLEQPSTSFMSPEKPTLEPITLSIPDMSLLQGVMPGLSPIGQKKHTISAQIDDKVHELNPITSFAELKYACEHDGLFFKLDLSNGVMVPINVCIQKSSAEQQLTTSTSNINISPTEVIDLTDELGNAINEEITSTAVMRPNRIDNPEQLLSKITARKLSTMMPLANTPDKNSVLKNVTKGPTLAMLKEANERKKQELLKRLSNNLKPLKLLQSHKRSVNILKRNLDNKVFLPKRSLYMNKVETKIDLVDSDAPMEEEYLVSESSEDSDDEPLAKIARKIRAPNENNSQVSQNQQEPQNESVAQVETVTQDIDFEEAIDSIEPVVPLVPVHPTVMAPAPAQEPVPTQLVLSGAAINQPILLNDTFLHTQDADDEDSQDCILGV